MSISVEFNVESKHDSPYYIIKFEGSDHSAEFIMYCPNSVNGEVGIPDVQNFIVNLNSGKGDCLIFCNNESNVSISCYNKKCSFKTTHCTITETDNWGTGSLSYTVDADVINETLHKLDSALFKDYVMMDFFDRNQTALSRDELGEVISECYYNIAKLALPKLLII